MGKEYTILVTIDRNLDEIIMKENLAINELLETAVFFISKDEILPYSQNADTIDIRCSLSKNIYLILNELAKNQGDYVNLISGQLIFEYYIKYIRYATS